MSDRNYHRQYQRHGGYIRKSPPPLPGEGRSGGFSPPSHGGVPGVRAVQGGVGNVHRGGLGRLGGRVAGGRSGYFAQSTFGRVHGQSNGQGGAISGRGSQSIDFEPSTHGPVHGHRYGRGGATSGRGSQSIDFEPSTHGPVHGHRYGRGGATSGRGSQSIDFEPSTHGPVHGHRYGRGGATSGRGSQSIDFEPSTHGQRYGRGGAMSGRGRESIDFATPSDAPVEVDKLPSRPGHGTVGESYDIRTNHFRVNTNWNDLNVYKYKVTLYPKLNDYSDRIEAMRMIVERHKHLFLGGKTPVYDGNVAVYTNGLLNLNSTKLSVATTQWHRPESTRSLREFKVTSKVTVKFFHPSNVDFEDLKQFLQGYRRDAPHPEYISILNLILRESKGHSAVERSASHHSLRPVQIGLSLNIDVSTMSIYEPIKVSDFVQKNICGRSKKCLSEIQLEQARKALVGVKVRVDHLQQPRMYIIGGVSNKCASELKFFDEVTKTETSVKDFFLSNYKLTLECTFLPVLEVKGAKKAYLPMEICKIVKGPNKYSKELLADDQIRSKMELNSTNPQDKENAIIQMVTNSNDLLRNNFCLQVEKTTTVVKARVLPSPTLNYQEGNVMPKNGKWNMAYQKMKSGGKIKHWTCISFCDRLNLDEVEQFCDKLVSYCSEKGMDFPRVPLVPIQVLKPCAIKAALVDVLSQSTKQLEKMRVIEGRLDLLIIVLPDSNRSYTYGAIKRECETDLGIITQCCRSCKVREMPSQFLEYLSLKINTKAQGKNHVLFDGISLVTDEPTMIFGADVDHESSGDGPSIAAVVASVDWPEITNYEVQFSAQPAGVEIIEDLGEMTRRHLIRFKSLMDYYPMRIIFYRDGVGETQFQDVLRLEVFAIQKACESLGMPQRPLLTFVVVQKRHHTRFFTDDPSKKDISGNVIAGTVVDTEICHPTEHDFYLKSNHGKKGTTSKPPHYHVLFDANHVSANDLQMLTNFLCYINVKSTRATPIVCPVYYADLAAARMRYYIGKKNSANDLDLPVINDYVKDSMFYC